MPNFTMLAQNSDYDYIKQAYLCALSIRKTNPNSKICLITNEEVPISYKEVFDDVVDIPWNDQAAKSSWKVENRWKIYHACPYEETIVIDTDMLILDDLSTWWNYLQRHDLYFTTNVLTYRDIKITSRYYRKSFVQHELPDIYCGLFYFKKSDLAHKFFEWLELVMNNWELFYGQFAGGKHFQKWPSLDVSSAIVIKILGLENQVTNKNISYPYFVHMKFHCQEWFNYVNDTWQEKVGVYLDRACNLKIGNFKQNGVFHYTEKDFVTDEIISIYENAIND